MSRHAQITSTHIAYGADQQTHARVDLFEVIAPGVRRRVETLDVSMAGALDDPAQMRAAVEAQLKAAGLISLEDRVLTEAEARAAVMHGTNP